MRCLSLLAIAAAASTAAAITCEEAAAGCDFFFDGHPDDVPQYDLCTSSPDNGPGFSDRILARSGDAVGVFNENVDVTALVDDAEEPIADLNAALTPHQFKPFSDSGVPLIGHETFQQDSRDAVIGQCFRVTFTEWQALGADGNVVANVRGTDSSCAVFRVGCGPDEGANAPPERRRRLRGTARA